MSKTLFIYRSRRRVKQVVAGKKHKAWAPAWSAGLLWNPHALWLGAHYSPMNRRHCINLVPCLTVWVRLPGGKEP